MAILRDGITLGGLFLPFRRTPRVYRGFIWLTDDPRFNGQHWASNLTGRCGDRTEVRFTIDVPESKELAPWNEIARSRFGLQPLDLIMFNLAGNSDGSHWYLYYGMIPRSWIKETAYKEKNSHGKP